jgi:hypothetical protein
MAAAASLPNGSSQTAYGPVAWNVAASSSAWSVGERLHIQTDNHNNRRLCAPHRN